MYQQQAHCRFGEDGDKAAESCLTVLLQGLGTTTRKLRQDHMSLVDPKILATGLCLYKSVVESRE